MNLLAQSKESAHVILAPAGLARQSWLSTADNHAGNANRLRIQELDSRESPETKEGKDLQLLFVLQAPPAPIAIV
jgi:hypothetical protein